MNVAATPGLAIWGFQALFGVALMVTGFTVTREISRVDRQEISIQELRENRAADKVLLHEMDKKLEEVRGDVKKLVSRP